MDTRLILLGGGVAVGAAALLYWRRRAPSASLLLTSKLVGRDDWMNPEMSIPGEAAPLSPAEALRKVVDREALPYIDIVLRVANEKNISPFVILALLKRETLYGTAPGYSPKGPGGVGDGGHGRGLMQIDDRTWGTWLATNNWKDAYTNIRKGVEILQEQIRYFSMKPSGSVTLSAADATIRGVRAGTYPDPRPLVGDLLVEASIAAYNTGMGRVLKSVASKASVDSTTANGDYSEVVLASAQRLSEKYNDIA